MDTLGRWMCVGALMFAGAGAQAADNVVLPTRKVDGNLDARARLQALHSEMRRECGVSPGSARCRRLKREFQQESKNYQKRHRK